MIDNICKFLAESFSSDFASWILGEAITFTKLEPSELSTEPIRADSVIFLESSEIILHIEFQTDPNKNIPFRMADYRLRLYRKFPEKQADPSSRYLPHSQPITTSPRNHIHPQRAKPSFQRHPTMGATHRNISAIPRIITLCYPISD